jgi:hypothetical protein
MKYKILILVVCMPWILSAQVSQFPFVENFDSVTAPDLPPGWTTTTNRLTGGDFTTTTSSELSFPNAVLSTNSTILQSLTTPLFVFSNVTADSLVFYERRSSSHNSGILLEASIDGGITFPLLITDTLKNPGTTSYVRRGFTLPNSLNNQSSVKLRWTVVGDGTGTTGTFRIDNLKITALAQVDVGATAIYFSPRFPIVGDSVIITATVKNFGTQSVQNIPVEFYEDANGDSTPDPEELIETMTITSTIQPFDTTVAEMQLSSLTLGERTIMVQTAVLTDQVQLNDLTIADLSVGLPFNSVVVNEIMYTPFSPEPEWIEITNIYPDSVNLKNWKISDQTTTTRHLLTLTDYWLQTNEYVVITKDSVDFWQVHPDVINAQFVSSMPVTYFNNTEDDVVIYDNRGATMDSVSYVSSWGGKNGKSLERIEQMVPSNDSSNWGTSGDSTGSTPGRYNFLTPLEYDVRAVRFIADDAMPGLAVPLQAVIYNSGRQTATKISVSFYDDVNRDSLPQLSELLQPPVSILSVAPEDSVIANYLWENPSSGEHLLLAVVDYSEDLRPRDNQTYGKLNVAFPKNILVINEILYDPPTGNVEYVELYNRSASAINLAQWKLNSFTISPMPFIVHAGTSVIVSADFSILQRFPYLNDTLFKVISLNRTSLGLDNDGDSVTVRDLTGEVIDSLYYLPTWHNSEIEDVSGRSLERINPNLPSTDRRNWSTCVDPLGGSPGKQNSIFTAVVPSSVTLSFSPNPFSPDGDGIEDHTVVLYQLPVTTALIRIRIYDGKGRLVRTLANNEPSGANGQVIWDGLDDNHERVRIGIYIVLLEALDSIGGELQKTKSVVVVATKL